MNSNLSKYNGVFKDLFGVEESELNNLSYNDFPEWNSIAHIALIANLEDVFNINFETEDIFSFTDYEKGKELLKEHYSISF